MGHFDLKKVRTVEPRNGTWAATECGWAGLEVPANGFLNRVSIPGLVLIEVEHCINSTFWVFVRFNDLRVFRAWESGLEDSGWWIVDNWTWRDAYRHVPSHEEVLLYTLYFRYRLDTILRTPYQNQQTRNELMYAYRPKHRTRTQDRTLRGSAPSC